LNTVTIEVEETFQETVQSVRLLVLEIPVDSPWDDSEWLRRVLHHGEADFGPFPTRPIEGTLERRRLGIRVIGETDLPPDIGSGVAR
jgi:hypothetical protein